MSISRDQIAEHWYEAAEEGSLSTDSYQGLRWALTQLLTQEALCGIGFRAELPVVLALQGSRLIVVEPLTDGAGDVAVQAGSLTLHERLRLRIEIRSQTERAWVIEDGIGEPFGVLVKAPRSRLGPDRGGREVMAAVADFLGWPIPG